MKLLAILLVVCVYAANAKLHCQAPFSDVPREWITMVDPCIKKMSEQVNEELTAAMTYMAMGAHFSKDIVNRPGFADLFFKSASEERDHAIKIIGYLLMRGRLTENVSKLIKDPKPVKFTWTNGLHALKDALNLETHVTRKIRGIIEVCESPAPNTEDVSFNDYHLVDYLTGEFLEEQYNGQRHLAGLASTLGKMMDSQGALAEFLFDKKLLNNEV